MNIIQTNMDPLTFTQHPAPQPRHRVAGLHVIQESLSRLTCATMEVPGGLLWFHQDPGGSEFSIQCMGSSSGRIQESSDRVFGLTSSIWNSFPPTIGISQGSSASKIHMFLSSYTTTRYVTIHRYFTRITRTHTSQWCGENSPGDPFVIEIQVLPLARYR